MSRLTAESAGRLQNVLQKRTGHYFSGDELESAYGNLIDFALALVDLTAGAPTCEVQKEFRFENLTRANICRPVFLSLETYNYLVV